MQIPAHTDIGPMMQEVSNAVQTQDHKGAVQEKNSNTYCYTTTCSNSNLNDSNAFIPMVKNNEVKYFLPSPCQESDIEASTEISKQLQRDFEDVFNGRGCFDEIFSLQINPKK